jgi:hypothetical protein
MLSDRYPPGIGGYMARSFYRVTRSLPPTLDDFLSQKARGIPMARPDPEVALLWDGVSVYATEAQARKQARAKPGLGAYIAEIVVNDGNPITVRRSGRGSGHHTLWGDPDELKARVMRTVAVKAAGDRHARVAVRG